jgi:hypothetical protein
MKKRITVTTVIDLENVLPEDEKYLVNLHKDNVSRLAGEGLMTGDSMSEVENWKCDVKLEKLFTIRHIEDGDERHLTVKEILHFLNKEEPHSDEWTDYDESDWQEGLQEFTYWDYVEDN